MLCLACDHGLGFGGELLLKVIIAKETCRIFSASVKDLENGKSVESMKYPENRSPILQ